MKKLLTTMRISILIFLTVFLFLPETTKAQNAWSVDETSCHLVNIPSICSSTETEVTGTPTLCEQAGIQGPGLCCCANKSTNNNQTTQTTNTEEAPKYVPLEFKTQIQIPVSGSVFNKIFTTSGSYDPSTGVMTSDLLAKYIKTLYDYGLMIGGILAAIVLMGGGILWLVSAGNDTKITQAKELIGGSVLGLVILFGSWIILNTVNPNLLNMKPIETKVAERTFFNIGCCVNKSTQKVSNDTKQGCGSNVFYENKYASESTNSCKLSGCCIYKQHDGSLAGRVLSCVNTIEDSCNIGGAGQYKDVFKTGQCSAFTECKNSINSCAGKKDGTDCSIVDNATPGNCYKDLCYTGLGKVNEPCGVEQYDKCDPDLEQNGKSCVGGTGGRSCGRGLWCCQFKADGTRINKN